ncbi:MAG: hypothetical protein U0670_23800, partial [Anaerolineae bacterium]
MAAPQPSSPATAQAGNQTEEKRDVLNLSEIRRLLESGENDSAMTQIESYLEAYPSDTEARLLKVEICFEARRDYGYVVDTLKALQGDAQWGEKLADLQQRRRALVEELVSEGRNQIARQISAGIPAFDNALVLEPDDPSVPFAAALALTRWKEEKRDELQPGMFGSAFPVPEGRRRMFLQAWAKGLEKYLRLARDRSVPGDTVHHKATERLIQFWLAQSDVHPDLLALLSDPAQSSEEVTKLTRQALVKVIEHAAGIMLRLLRAEEDAEASKLLAVCKPYAESVPLIPLIDGQMALIAGDRDHAKASFTAALTTVPLRMKAKTALTTAQRILKATGAVQTTCKQCGRVTSMPEQFCSLCGSNLYTRPLIDERYQLESTQAVLLARIGLAELLRDTDPAEVETHVTAVLAELGKEHRAVPLVNELLAHAENSTPKDQNPAEQAIALLREEGVTPAVLHHLNRVTEQHPARWLEVPVATRVSIVRRLIKADALKAAKSLIAVAFTDKPERESVRTLNEELTDAIQEMSAKAVEAARHELESSDAEGAIQILSGAMELDQSDAMI